MTTRTIPTSPVLTERLNSLPMPDAERQRAAQLVERGEFIADSILAVLHLFQRAPELRIDAR